MRKTVKKGRRPWQKNEKCYFIKDTIQYIIQYGSKPLFWKLIIFQSTVEEKNTEHQYIIDALA